MRTILSERLMAMWDNGEYTGVVAELAKNPPFAIVDLCQEFILGYNPAVAKQEVHRLAQMLRPKTQPETPRKERPYGRRRD